MTAFRQCTVHGATIIGVKAHPVDVEVVVSNGVPGFSVVGMPDAAIQEARERVRAALRACGFRMPSQKVVVNLAPGSLKKTGSGFDLPIAVGLLAATGQIPDSMFVGLLLVGELSLEGTARPVKGMLAYELCARENGWGLLCSHATVGLVRMKGMDIRTVDTLGSFLHGRFERPLERDRVGVVTQPDFGDVGGHELAKRALQIAATGSHGVLMMGPPGSGKTMLASCIPGILPPLGEEERIQTAQIHSVVGEDTASILAGIRPFRSPHHSASMAGLIGGGTPVHPGELSLAHNGVLFLDELAEFRPSVLQGIRKPLEDGTITITRVEGNVVMPAEFMLVAASNPCSCGYCGDEKIACTCTPTQIHAYQNRIGGPLIDRIDICIDVWRSDYKDIVEHASGTDSHTIREGVLAGRAFARERMKGRGMWGAHKDTHDAVRACEMDADTKDFLEGMARAYVLSGRGIVRTLAIARTIADLAEQPTVKREHIAEALNMRVRSQVGRA